MGRLTADARRIANQVAASTLKRLFAEHDLRHLDVLSRGDHLVVYSLEESDKVNRFRLTRLSRSDQYQLGFADHRGKWDPTPYTGTIAELITLVIEQFPFILAEY